MIRAVIVMNTQGKPRLLKFYEFQPPEKQQELTRSVFAVLSGRPDNVSNFVEADAIFGPGTRLIYNNQMKTTVFMYVELGSSYVQMHTILDEIIFGGQVLETSSERVLKAVEEISRLEKSSSSVSFVPKSVSGRFGR
ncbi:AP-3 complex subunit [Musa troglodytarum]|uniref:AP complex subunit sigma n=1 Tax=Musa troglodytarum TaxID=320322 RepID=A0A9E7HL13_9LILI|nr:AP-3 complex subunit [Musa troglodytarum]